MNQEEVQSEPKSGLDQLLDVTDAWALRELVQRVAASRADILCGCVEHSQEQAVLTAQARRSVSHLS